uniref:Uncharacterized protein n=1 Tax=viral metagenome TaxID=1070528 RepID=A0A6C0J3C5_9ZZZZ
MRFTDKMCYEVSKDIIEDIFLIKYTPTIIKEKTWYDNLNSFLVKEWIRIQTVEDDIEQFTENEEHGIIGDAMQILLDNLEIDEDEWEEHEEDIDWGRFDDIIGHYICQYNPNMYGVDGKELTNEMHFAVGG